MNIFKQKLKKSNNKKGFTLVEIIVVLVILAILAAAAVPTMLGFVEDSKGKAEIANARAAYIACQSIATEEYASGATATISTSNTYTISKTEGTGSKTNSIKLNKMLGADMEGAKVEPTITNGKVETVVYISPTKTGKSQYKVTIKPEETAVVEKYTAPAANPSNP